LWRDGELHPLRDEGAHCWEQSAVRIHARHAKSLEAEWQQRFGSALQQLRSRYRLLEEPAFVLPLMEEGGRLMARVQDERGRVSEMFYDRHSGLSW
jgi:CRISPR-associated endonuclease/helicase Cas3